MQTPRIIKPITLFAVRPNFIARVEALVLKNLDNEEFCMADLQSNLLMSSSQVYRKIKKQTGHSPSVYVRNIRLQYGRELMLRTDLSLSEIAYRVGFNGLPYFSRCFTNLYGVSPSSYRYLNAG